MGRRRKWTIIVVVAAALVLGAFSVTPGWASLIGREQARSNRVATLAYYANDFVTHGISPSAVVFDGRHIWVANQNQRVTSLDPATGALVTASGTPSSPVALAFDGESIRVANCFSNNVERFATAHHGSIALGGKLGTYPVGRQPRAIAFDGSDIWVVNSGDN